MLLDHQTRFREAAEAKRSRRCWKKRQTGRVSEESCPAICPLETGQMAVVIGLSGVLFFALSPSQSPECVSDMDEIGRFREHSACFQFGDEYDGDLDVENSILTERYGITRALGDRWLKYRSTGARSTNG